ncbi:M15 family metallopeptidase [Leeuwenhoekiella aequorea]|uniref:D-alanyl-D-alanine dipeptidase n=1 Tax=Leeuwenhoekiella aequorea TaxID=283736 RepID=A0A4Q0PA36_9FLAO|nr:M15 family metallopeptidase [Leeuwenhoekiella aequorea]RXG23613.1 D-alanyl-D-alanine dipeptidase [Leeuwenhoekiella aequorea]
MKLYSLYFLLFINLFAYAQNSKQLVLLDTINDGFAYDIRYATSNNFLKEAFYDCAACYLRPEVANALKEANHYFCEMGYKIVLFDCYRPVSAQKKMWKVFPNPQYVANPYKSGSVHNRGAAVDISLAKLDGIPVDMGTDHDFFGREAHIDNTSLPKQVLQNRKILQDGMRKFGFETIRTEWWHFNYKKNYSFQIIDFNFECN